MKRLIYLIVFITMSYNSYSQYERFLVAPSFKQDTLHFYTIPICYKICGEFVSPKIADIALSWSIDTLYHNKFINMLAWIETSNDEDCGWFVIPKFYGNISFRISAKIDNKDNHSISIDDLTFDKLDQIDSIMLHLDRDYSYKDENFKPFKNYYSFNLGFYLNNDDGSKKGLGDQKLTKSTFFSKDIRRIIRNCKTNK